LLRNKKCVTNLENPFLSEGIFLLSRRREVLLMVKDIAWGCCFISIVE